MLKHGFGQGSGQTGGVTAPEETFPVMEMDPEHRLVQAGIPLFSIIFNLSKFWHKSSGLKDTF